jgi:hypothetical protein
MHQDSLGPDGVLGSHDVGIVPFSPQNQHVLHEALAFNDDIHVLVELCLAAVPLEIHAVQAVSILYPFHVKPASMLCQVSSGWSQGEELARRSLRDREGSWRSIEVVLKVWNWCGLGVRERTVLVWLRTELPRQPQGLCHPGNEPTYYYYEPPLRLAVHPSAALQRPLGPVHDF